MDTEQFNQAYERLTPKQKEVLKPFLAGEPEEAIAQILDCDPSNVRHHIANSCSKFGFANQKGEHFRQRQELVELFAKHKPEWVSTEIVKKYLGQTLPMVELESQDGSVELDSAFYVERSPIESICYETLLQPGSLIRIKAPSMMGKTLLINRVLGQVKAKQGYRNVNLSLKLADRRDFNNLDKFLWWFCKSVSLELGLSSQLEDYWEEGDGSKSNCTTYFEEYLLKAADSPLLLCLDDVDVIFPYPEIYEDFFDLLRFWYERAKSRPLWKRLRLVVVHSTEVYITLNINKSPFNVGVPIELSEFTPKQVQDFAKQHGLDWDAAQVEKLMKMVGGHPYLVQQAIAYLKNHKNVTVDEFLETAPTEAGIYSNRLREHLLDLQQHPELVTALKEVVTATNPVRIETIAGHKLHSRGLLKRQGNEVMPSCDLYRVYFSERLGDS
jgi:DNA-binding CsgD family transcriptional regulator